MKKPYQKPTLVRRELLNSIAAGPPVKLVSGFAEEID
jgi:hypothetical protein